MTTERVNKRPERKTVLVVEDSPVQALALVQLLERLWEGEINMLTAKSVLAEMYASGQPAGEIIARRGLRQISDSAAIGGLVGRVIADYPREVAAYLAGKETLSNWFFGQVMQQARGQANPQLVQAELARQLAEMKRESLQ